MRSAMYCRPFLCPASLFAACLASGCHRPSAPAEEPLPKAPVKVEAAQKDAESRQKSVAAKYAAATAELKALDAQLDFYTVRAPIAGRLGTFMAVPGQTLTVGTVIAEVVDLDSIDVLCYAPPDAAGR